jgi:hypothetical protein
MDKEYISNELQKWMVDFVEKPNALLNGWAPCPYARQARVEGKVEILFSDTSRLKTNVMSYLHLLDEKEVLVVCFDHTEIEPEVLSNVVHDINVSLHDLGFIVLEDHPDDKEILNGVTMNFGKCGILFVQRTDKLNTATETLKQKGYYDHWPQENYDDVVGWRYHDDLRKN